MGDLGNVRTGAVTGMMRTLRCILTETDRSENRRKGKRLREMRLLLQKAWSRFFPWASHSRYGEVVTTESFAVMLGSRLFTELGTGVKFGEGSVYKGFFFSDVVYGFFNLMAKTRNYCNS